MAAEPDRPNNPKEPYGVCPFCSGASALLAATPPLSMNDPKGIIGVSQPQVIPVNITAPCVGPRCQLWVEDFEGCTFRSVARLKGIDVRLAALEKPRAIDPTRDAQFEKLVDIFERLGKLLQPSASKPSILK